MACRIVIHQGDSLRREFRAVDPVTGAPVDLTGLDVEFEVKLADNDPDPPLIARQIGAGITLADQNDPDTVGVLTVILDPIHTRDLDPGTYRYDVVWEGVDGRFHVPGTPEDFVVTGVVNQADGAGPPPVPGMPASQSEQERSFTHTWSATGQTDVVTIPGAGMYDTSYIVAVSVRSIPPGGVVPATILPTAQTTTQLTLDCGEDSWMLEGTVLDVFLRDS